MLQTRDTLLLGTCFEKLEGVGDIPDNWVLWDRLSQGQITRYWYREQKSEETTPHSGGWLVVKAFKTQAPQWLAIWTQSTPPEIKTLKELLPHIQHCFYIKDNFAPQAEKHILNEWPEAQAKEVYEL